MPNFGRPWEEGHDAESSSSAFVVQVEVEVHQLVPANTQGPEAAAAAAAGAAAGAAGASGGNGRQGARRPKGKSRRGEQLVVQEQPQAAWRRVVRKEKQLLLMTTAGAVEHAKKVGSSS